MKVFVSSVISGFRDFRDAACGAIRSLGYEVLRAEDFGASASSPQQACLAGVREADLTVLLLGEKYGTKQASGLSATHEEYREARQHGRVLAFVQQGVEHEPDQAALTQEVQQWETGTLTVEFTTSDDLQIAVTRELHRFAVAAATLPIDDQALLAQAKQGLSRSTSSQVGPQLVLSIALGPHQEILRPSEMEGEALVRDLQQQALLGPQALFTVEEGTRTDLRSGWLVLSQETTSLEINSTGQIVIRRLATRPRDHIELAALIEEDIESQLVLALQFAAALLERVDSLRRLSHVVVIAAVTGLSYEPWRTRAEHARSPTSGTLRTGGSSVIAHLSPSTRPRGEMGQHSRELARDLMVLLRRQLRENNAWASDGSLSFS